MPNIIDHIIDTKVGLGKAQIVAYIFICLVDVNDGVQGILISLTTPILKQEWNLTDAQSQAISSLFFVGALIGALISGKFSDFFGRKPSVLIGSIMQIIAAVMFVFVNNYGFLLFARCFYGIAFGFTLAQTPTYVAQTSPSKYRGKLLVLLNFCASGGKFLGLLIGYLYMDNFTTGSWKKMIVIGCSPNILVFIAAVFILKETPRYLIATKQLDKALQVLKWMAIQNKKISSEQIHISERQKESIEEEQQRLYTGQHQAEFKQLFNSYYLGTTICLSFIWFCINFMYFGQLIILPFILGKENKTFGSYALTIVGELPTIIASLLIIDRQKFGRKHSLIYIFCCCACCHLLFAVDQITTFSFLSRFFMKMVFQILYPCTTESYSTLNRSSGIGFNSAIGRIGAIIMPFIVIPLSENHTVIVFVCFIATSLIGAISAYLLPRQPLDMTLDQKQIVQVDTRSDPQQQEGQKKQDKYIDLQQVV